MRDSSTLAPPIGFPTDQPKPRPIKSDEQDPASISAPQSKRLVSLDAYRGFVMILMASSGLGIASFVGQHEYLNSAWHAVAYQADHVQWRGCALWDLIQPSFTFIVGVALPFSLAKRISQGQSFGRLFFHAFIRSLILIGLGIFLRSIGKPQTNFMFTDTLAQIGLGYPIAFLLAWTRPRWQIVAIAVLLIGYWAAFAMWHLPPDGFDYSAVGVKPDWYAQFGLRNFSSLHPFAAHWDKNTNIAAAFDAWFMNLFPRTERFLFEGGGYQTLNFIPTLATILLGLQAGNLMKSERRPITRFGWLVGFGLLGIAVGWILDYTGVCPSVKRIWTPSWVLFSGGWSCVLLALFYLIVDCAKWRWFAFPMVVVGMNSIAMYCMADGGFETYIRHALGRHLGQQFFDKVSYRCNPIFEWICQLFHHPGHDPALSFGPMFESATTLLVLWLVCFWMYRRKIFLRI